MNANDNNNNIKNEMNIKKKIVNRVAIIGSGAAGIIVSDVFNSHNIDYPSNSDISFKITIFEQSNEIGGVWNYHHSDSSKLLFFINDRLY